jgi:hypothetical protein
MPARVAWPVMILLTGCAATATPPVPDPGASSMILPAAAPMASTDRPIVLVPASRPAPAARPSDWATTIIGSPFVLGFRAVVCAASAVAAGPMAALFAVSDDSRRGFAYLRSGLAENCGGPYAVPLPSASDRAREQEFVGYAPETYVLRGSLTPDLRPPRSLTPYGGTAGTWP